MDELIQLLQSFGLDADNPDYTTLTDEQLAELQTALFALFDETRDADVPDLELLEAIALGGEAIRVEDAARQEQATADAARIAELEQQLRPAAEGDDPADPADPEADPADPDADPEDPADPADPEDVTDPAEPVAVAAAATPRRVSLSQLAAQRRAANTPTPADAGNDTARVVITAGGDIPGVSAGQPLEDLDHAARALLARLAAVDGTRLAPGQKFQVARLRTEYPDERQMSRSNVEQNLARYEAVVASARQAFLDGDTGSFDALAAAGGRCSPLTTRYEQDTVGDDARPIAAAFPSFQGRGGVRFIPGPVLTDIDTAGADGAVGQWTNTDDTNALNGEPTKPIQRIDCGDETTVEDYAVTKRLLVGANLARTSPERVRAMIDLTNVAWARYAEQLLLDRIKALSVQSMEDLQVLGSRRDLLAVWIKAAWAIRNRHRMAEDEPLQLIVPDAVIAHAQIDGLRQLPGDQRDRITRDEFVGEMRAINVDPIITRDMPAHLAGVQTAGAQLVDLPSPINWAMFPMGTFAYIDGGDFDLGFTAGTPIRDTATLAVNDYQLFAENWENIAKFGGPESLWGRTLVCPTGTTAATTEVDCGEAS